VTVRPESVERLDDLLADPPPDTRDATAASAAVRALLLAGAGDLPLPGRGRTGERFAALRRIARWDVVVGRHVEAHADALAILADLDPGTPPADRTQWWGVWAAEPPGRPGLTAVEDGSGDGWRLTGVKPWCSGSTMCTHALVTATTADGERRLFAVALAEPGVRPEPDHWHTAAMAGTATHPVDFTGVAARAVGAPLAYLERPGFWHGAAGVAACWLGGADGVLARLVEAGAGGRLDPHGLAHLGACAAAVSAAGAELHTAAVAFDADPGDGAGTARLTAMRARVVVERAATEVLDRTGRALGPAPLAMEPAHARRVADLQLYLRQSHAERDLATLGELVAAAR
jgi:hypothetical protein